jgi:hypothetical protein
MAQERKKWSMAQKLQMMQKVAFVAFQKGHMGV